MIEIPEVPLWKERQTQELHKRIAELEAAGQKQTAIHSQAMQEMNDMLVARDKRIAELEAEILRWREALDSAEKRGIELKAERDRLKEVLEDVSRCVRNCSACQISVREALNNPDTK